MNTASRFIWHLQVFPKSDELQVQRVFNDDFTGLKRRKTAWKTAIEIVLVCCTQGRIKAQAMDHGHAMVLGASRSRTLVKLVPPDNNNNNQDSVYCAVVMTQSHCESSPGSRDEWKTAPGGCRPLDQTNRRSSHTPACRLLGNYIHHRHLLLFSPKSDTHFTIPAESRRLSRPRRLVTCPDGLPLYLSASSHPSK